MEPTRGPGCCVFCFASITAETREHMLPESFGGGEKFVLPPGIICHTCNQYFGREVENRVLASWPFNELRISSGIPTKKGRMHEMLPQQAR